MCDLWHWSTQQLFTSAKKAISLFSAGKLWSLSFGSSTERFPAEMATVQHLENAQKLPIVVFIAFLLLFLFLSAHDNLIFPICLTGEGAVVFVLYTFSLFCSSRHFDLSATGVNDPKPQTFRGKYYDQVGFPALIITALSECVLHEGRRHVRQRSRHFIIAFSWVIMASPHVRGPRCWFGNMKINIMHSSVCWQGRDSGILQAYNLIPCLEKCDSCTSGLNICIYCQRASNPKNPQGVLQILM